MMLNEYNLLLHFGGTSSLICLTISIKLIIVVRLSKLVLDLTPKRLLRSGSLNLNGIFDTCNRFGVLSLFCWPAALISATCCCVAALTTACVLGGGEVTFCWVITTDDGRIVPPVVVVDATTACGNVVWGGGSEFWGGGGAPACPVGEPWPPPTSEQSSPVFRRNKAVSYTWFKNTEV